MLLIQDGVALGLAATVGVASYRLGVKDSDDIRITYLCRSPGPRGLVACVWAAWPVHVHILGTKEIKVDISKD